MEKSIKVFVVGTGSWGTALGNVLADNNQEVLIYGRNQSEVDDINNNHRNSRYFDDTPLNPNLEATIDFKDIEDYDTVLLAVPSNVSCDMAERMKEYIKKPITIINAAKGFHPQTFKRLSEMISEIMTEKYLSDYYALIGPSHAEEVIKRMLTTVNIVGANQQKAVELQKAFSNDYFRVYRNDDLIGCEYASGLKNVIALASGMLYGQGLGDNAKASLMTRGLSEMSRYGLAKGGRLDSFMGLCGMGDLIVTCTSPFSRNWQAGYQIGKDDGASLFWQNNTKTVEGVNACKIIHLQAIQDGIEMPITNEVYKVLFENKKPSKAVVDLMKRELKYEIY